MENAYIAQALGKVVRAVREERKLRRHEVVSALPGKPHEQTLASWERGKRAMTVQRLMDLATVYGVPAHVLLKNAEELAVNPSGTPSTIGETFRRVSTAEKLRLIAQDVSELADRVERRKKASV